MYSRVFSKQDDVRRDQPLKALALEIQTQEVQTGSQPISSPDNRWC